MNYRSGNDAPIPMRVGWLGQIEPLIFHVITLEYVPSRRNDTVLVDRNLIVKDTGDDLEVIFCARQAPVCPD